MIYYLQLYPSIELATAYYSSEKQQVNHEEQNERLIVYLKLFSGKSKSSFEKCLKWALIYSDSSLSRDSTIFWTIYPIVKKPFTTWSLLCVV